MYAVLNDELYHHGIKGQKWGVRRFQNADGSLTSAGRSRYGYGKGSDGSKATPNTSNKKNKILNSKIPKTSKGFGELSNEEAAFLAEAGAAIVSLAALRTAATLYYNKKEKREQAENKENNPFSAVKKTKPAAKKEDDMAKVNPDYGTARGSTMNCVLCTTTYEMRRRGYDVTANFSECGRDIKAISNYYKDTTKKDWINTKGSLTAKRGEQKVMEAFDKMPDGSRGNICAAVGAFSSQHSMVWEKENGKVTIRDCQTNTVYNSDNLFWKRGSKGIVRPEQNVQILRTDNREINTDNIMDAIKPVSK